MTISRHLDDATLMSFAAGSLPEGLAAVAAAHIAMCTHCRHEMRAMERLGGALMGELAPMRLNRPAALVDPAASPVVRPAVPRPSTDLITRLLGRNLDGINWRWIGLGVWQCPVPLTGQGTLNLIRVSPGRGVPDHTHAGSELTLVLQGSLHDVTGVYSRGDVADLDEEIEHEPFAGEERDCICLVASEKPARFRGLIARLMQPWHGM